MLVKATSKPAFVKGKDLQVVQGPMAKHLNLLFASPPDYFKVKLFSLRKSFSLRALDTGASSTSVGFVC